MLFQKSEKNKEENMLKKLTAAIIFIISCLSVSALEIENNKIKDNRGNFIDLHEYKRIIILDPAVTETFYMIGAEKKISAIGTTAKSKIYPEEKTKNLPNVGNIVNMNIEKVLSFSPDLIILNPMAVNMGETLKTFKIPYIVNETETFEDILKNIKIYGVITGQTKEAETLYNESLKKMDNLKTLVKEKPLNIKGALLYSSSPMMAFNEKSLPGQIFTLLGVENIAENLTGDKPIISPEFLLKENPDFLAGAMSIKSETDILNSSPAVKQTKAGEKNNLFIVDSSKILRGSPRIFEAVEEFYTELKNLKY